jgi:hypothetical protein
LTGKKPERESPASVKLANAKEASSKVANPKVVSGMYGRRRRRELWVT